MDPTFKDPVYPTVSPSLMKPEWSDLSQFKFNPAFSLGPEYDQYTKECLDWIPDASVLLDDYDEEPATSAAPQPPTKRSKLSLNRRGKPGCLSAVVVAPLKETTNTVARFATPVTSPERKKAAKGVITVNTEASTRWAIKKNSTLGLLIAPLLTRKILFHLIC